MYADAWWLSRNGADRAAVLAADLEALNALYGKIEAEIVRLDNLRDRALWPRMDALNDRLAALEAAIKRKSEEADDLAFARWAESHRGLFARGPQ
jgi:hypothetical protein